MKRIYLTYCFVLFALALAAQDIHYSQFDRSPLNLNPALTGLFNGDLRFTANIRDQWESVPVPYRSASGSFDTKLLRKRMSNHVLGAGFLFNYDQAGDSKMQWLTMGGSVGYAHRLSESIWLSGGGLIEYRQRSFSSESLTFDDQFLGDVFDPDRMSNEQITGQTIRFIDLSAGTNLRFQWGESNRLDIGSAVYHIGQPDQSFFDDVSAPLNRRWNIQSRFQFSVQEQLAFRISGLFQKQGVYREIVYGLSGILDLDEHDRREKAVILGVWNRWQDAIIVEAGFKIQQLEIALSYDINISDFNAATNGQGGPELGLIYLITKVKDIGDQKACPIF